MADKNTKSGEKPEATRRTNVAVNDRMAGRGADYAYDNNASGEGNDASLSAGPTFERRVHADGHVEGVEPSRARSADGQDAAAAHAGLPSSTRDVGKDAVGQEGDPGADSGHEESGQRDA
ncbi:MAG: hypothetical protein ACJ8GV_15255 [Luteimonas sp.]